MSDNGLRVVGLRKQFGERRAVDGLDLAVGHGEILGLLGPNGAGKTTTLLCLGGLLRPDAGSIEFGGRVLGVDRGATLALIPETPEVYPLLTVWEHLAFVARGMRLDASWVGRAEALLTRVGLESERNTLGQALSKGMRQKTLLAATMLAQTPVLLLDEPLVGLDPKGQRELRQLLRELRGAGTAILMSTHQIESAEALCDRVVIMKAGAKIAEGPVAQLLLGNEGTLEDIFLEITA
ncbi:MAG: ABC transporter ATP-binding protein [Vulcanimicrobiaceae bacterium]